MSSQWIDSAKPVRSGEVLDVDLLETYLKAHLPDLEGDLAVTQFPSGFSNLTYKLQIGSQEFVLRRPPFGANIKSAHDMGREYKILSSLHEVYSKSPKALLYCEDEAVMGASFYVMERVKGIVLRATSPKEMLPEADLMGRIATSFISNLVDLHAVDYEAAGLGDLGRPAGYVERQIKGWSKRYNNAKTDEWPEMDQAMTWLAENMPPETDATLIHNDYKYDNVILDAEDWSEIKAVLDWEMTTLGDPLMDLG
ncbi:MAG: phosphotransferase family protein, partial [Chloroflexota bacterium]